MANEWYKSDKNGKNREIIIKLSKKNLKLAGYILIIIALIAVIAAQHYELIPSRSKISTEKPSEVVGPIDEESSLETVEEVDDEEEPATEETTETVNTTTTESTNTTTTNTTEEEEEDLLPITGEITLIIDKINIDPKPNIEDYARVTSIKFTILNQYKDFTPRVEVELVGDDDDTVKEVTYTALKAGETFTKTETKFTFGYNDVDQEYTIKLQVYSGSKLLKTVTKAFSTP